MFVSFGHTGRHPEREHWRVSASYRKLESGKMYRGIQIDAGPDDGWLSISFPSKEDERRFFEALRVAAQEMDMMDGTATPATALKTTRTPKQQKATVQS